MKLITRWLPVKLTREEREVRASDLAATMTDRETKAGHLSRVFGLLDGALEVGS